jgi:hypothetical protein
MKKSILEKYGNKEVNPKYYGTVTISGSSTGMTNTLTRKEFQEGKQGLVWMDNITGKLVFKDDEQPLGIMEQIRLEQVNKPPVRIEEELQRMNIASRKPKFMTIYGGFEFIEKLRKALPKKFFK